MTRVTAAMLTTLCVLLVAGCGIRVPEDRREYIGVWRGSGMTLVITADGRVEYERREGSVSKSLSAPIRAFEGDDFIVGIPLLTTRFRVERPPYREGDAWKMRVDGVELLRVER